MNLKLVEMVNVKNLRRINLSKKNLDLVYNFRTENSKAIFNYSAFQTHS